MMAGIGFQQRVQFVGRADPVPETIDAGCRRGLTLVELLVVIVIIGVLLTILFPAIQRSRHAARRMQCQNHLVQIGLALHNYHGIHNTLPPGWTGVTDGKPAALGGPGWGWAAQLLGMLDQEPLSELTSFDQPIASGVNKRARTAEVFVFRCPADQSEPTWRMGPPLSNLRIAGSNYVGAFGSRGWDEAAARRVGQTLRGDGVFSHNSSTRFVDVTDGISSTVLVGERASDAERNQHATWVGVVPEVENAIARVVATGETIPATRPGQARGFSSNHGTGAMFLFGDGRVLYVDGRIAGNIFSAVMSRAGGELAPGY